MYYGYYRESAKHRTEWICVTKSECREDVKFKLKLIISRDRSMFHFGSRAKITEQPMKGKRS